MSKEEEPINDSGAPFPEPKDGSPLIDWDALYRLEELADQTQSREELEALLESMGYTRLD